jgi:hypothetical protein
MELFHLHLCIEGTGSVLASCCDPHHNPSI